MAILNLFTHGNVEGDAESVDEVLLLVAVEHDRMHQTDRGLTGVKVEADMERKPFPSGGRSFVHTIELHNCSYGTGLFNRDFAYRTDKLFTQSNFFGFAI